MSDAIQKIIDENPNRTIYFPDGTYLISKPICTPADPSKSVALELSNYAIIKATEDWNNEEAMIRLGGKAPFNNITTPGSNYYLAGGVIDGSGVAKGVSIDSGRETVIRNTSIKGVSLGIHVKHGANSGSSDADIHSVNIVGNCKPDCVGVLVEGYDNTFTNMRIGGVHIGFLIRSTTSIYSFAKIHCLISRIIVVSEHTWCTDDLHIVNSIVMKHLDSYITSCHAVHQRHLGILLELVFQIGLHQITDEGNTDK